MALTTTAAATTIARTCQRAIEDGGLFAALKALNSTTPYRFTGIYRFEGRWVRSVWLFDRERPEAQLGSDVLWDESYCRLTATSGASCEIIDALADARLLDHAARQAVQSYVAVLLKDPADAPLGTLCHYDVHPHDTPGGTLEVLKSVAGLVQNAVWAELRLTGRGASRNEERSQEHEV